MRGTDFGIENERTKTAYKATSANPALPKHPSSLDLVAGTFFRSPDGHRVGGGETVPSLAGA